MGPGTYFGEMALFHERQRRVSICAMHDCIMLTLRAQEFDLIVARNPAVFAQMRQHAQERWSKQQGLIANGNEGVTDSEGSCCDEHTGDASNAELSKDADAHEAFTSSAQTLPNEKVRERDQTLRYARGLAQLSSEVWDLKAQLMQLLHKASHVPQSSSFTEANHDLSA
eukprot:CAMPEP_0119306566 /NCGR_PEP_ID=MMETSP1333-20130426/7289_1 /TAXON_ID=418940 /ORGANISM="Scyphosphaera apsteinii, Strain RCC1455" /LENGTH=168 /DNA_ID=CAMNT_0007309891 /DNA_START=27 /DNA_END=533 /DNA_ORIENTATION=-